VPHDDYRDELITGEAVALDLRAASFVLRGAGAMIDFVVYVGTFVLIVYLESILSASLGLDAATDRALGVVSLAVCIVVIPTAVETLSHGKSLGKLAVGARIVRDDGGAIGFRHAFIRSLTGVLEIFSTLGGIAALAALLNSKSKRFGDMLAGTYSQYERVSTITPPIYGVPVELLSWAKTADVAKLPDPLARRLAQFLHNARGFTPATRERMASALASEAAAFVSPIPSAHPELFLAAVVTLRREREARALDIEAASLEKLHPVLGGLPHAFPDR
jgi:uncharacterized RDD family membrane protein YckC